MFTSTFISNLLSTVPIQEQEDLIKRIGYNLLSKVQELEQELESINELTLPKNKLRDFSKEMIIRKIWLLLQEFTKFPGEKLDEYTEYVEFVRASIEIPYCKQDVTNLSIQEMRELVKEEITRLHNKIDRKLERLAPNDYSKQELTKFSDLLEYKLKGLEKRLEFTIHTPINTAEKLPEKDQELQNMFKEFELLNRPIDLPRVIPTPPTDKNSRRNVRSFKYSSNLIPSKPNTPKSSKFNRRNILNPISFKKSLVLN
jgi:hypothetical protein